jgi:hypothetical protein
MDFEGADLTLIVGMTKTLAQVGHWALIPDWHASTEIFCWQCGQ